MEEEKVEDGRPSESERGSDGGADTGAVDGGQESGGTEGTDTGVKRRTKRDKGGPKRDANSPKSELLESIRTRRNQKLAEHSDNNNEAGEGRISGDESASEESQQYYVDELGVVTGASSGGVRSKRRPDVPNSSSLDDSDGVDERRGIKEKPRGAELVIPKFAPPSKGARKPIDTKPREEPVLTKKEGTEILPRVKESLKVFFKFSDKAIDMTTKGSVEHNIWSSIEDEEVEMLATYLVEAGQTNKILAGTVRKMSKSYKQMQLGVILLPRFIMTFRSYMTEGFAIPFGNSK